MSQDASEDGDNSSPVSSARMDRGVNKLDILNRTIPEEDDWDAKTKHDINDPWRVAALRNLGEIIPSVQHQQPIIDSWLDDYLKNRPSLDGEARDDMYSTLKAAFGSGSDGEGSDAGFVVKSLGADEED